MIKYWLQLLWILSTNWYRARKSPESEIDFYFRCGFFDCELARIMTSYKYPVYMDLARWAFITRLGFTKAMFKYKWAPGIAGQKIIYKKPIKIFTKFKIKVSFAGWDDLWFYNLHIFEQNGEIKAIGVTRGLIWKNSARISVDEVLREAQISQKRVTAPTWVQKMFEDDKENLSKFKMDCAQINTKGE